MFGWFKSGSKASKSSVQISSIPSPISIIKWLFCGIKSQNPKKWKSFKRHFNKSTNDHPFICSLGSQCFGENENESLLSICPQKFSKSISENIIHTCPALQNASVIRRHFLLFFSKIEWKRKGKNKGKWTFSPSLKRNPKIISAILASFSSTWKGSEFLMNLTIAPEMATRTEALLAFLKMVEQYLSALSRFQVLVGAALFALVFLLIATVWIVLFATADSKTLYKVFSAACLTSKSSSSKSFFFETSFSNWEKKEREERRVKKEG